MSPVSKLQSFFKNMTPYDAELVISSLKKFRRTSELLVEHPDVMLHDLSSYPSTNYVVFPCDVVELRRILDREAISGMGKVVPFFSLRFAEKYLNQYSIFVVVDKRLLPTSMGDHSGIMFYPPEVPNAIRRVMVNHPVGIGVQNNVREIVKEVAPDVEFVVSNSVPGLSPPARHASGKFNLSKISQMKEMPKINLNSQEQQIFDLLKATKNAYNLPTEFRVAGGWVRDKLLGQDSDDIDIAVGIPGTEAAQAVERYAQSQGVEGVGQGYSVSLEKSADPENKPETDDLMVGAIDIFGLKVEFVPMRVEHYPDPNSRQPEVALTQNVEDDVVRRDLTINAMYYNVGTGQVEDYVGGLEDLNNMHLRTPADPMRTFTDDPLRMLRAIRFMTKYEGATMDPALVEALNSPETHEAYKKKVAPERAEKEISKIFGSTQSSAGARLLFESGLYKTVLGIPEDWHPITVDQQNPHHNLNLMEHTLAVMENYNDLTKDIDIPADQRMLMNLSTFSHDIAKMHPQVRAPKMQKDPAGGDDTPVTFDRDGNQFEHMQYIGHEDEGAEFMQAAMKRMGFDKFKREFLGTVIKNHMTPHNFSKKMKPEDMGNFIAATGDQYERVLEHALADALSKGHVDEEHAEKIKEQYLGRHSKIRDYREEHGDRINKPLVDGNRLRELANSVDPEMVQQNAQVPFKDYGGKPVHYMKYINDRMLKRQRQLKIMTPEDGEKWLIDEIRQFSSLWRQTAQMPKLVREDQANVNLIDHKAIVPNFPGIHPGQYMGQLVTWLKSQNLQSPEDVQQKVLEWKSQNQHLFQEPQQPPSKPKVQAGSWYKRRK